MPITLVDNAQTVPAAEIAERDALIVALTTIVSFLPLIRAA
jgi:hypothetical protein